MTKKSRKQGLLRSVFRNESGAMAAWFALMVPVFLGFGALALDLSYQMLIRHKLQTAASAAALAGAAKLPVVADAQAEAVAYAASNMPDAVNGGPVAVTSDVTAGNWDFDTRVFLAEANFPAVDPPIVNAVEVLTNRVDDADHSNPIGLFLAGAVGLTQMESQALAIAVQNPVTSEQAACMISLDPDESQTFLMQGTPTINAEDCGICVNSSADDAFDINGNGTFNLDSGNVSIVADDWDVPNGQAWDFIDEDGNEIPWDQVVTEGQGQGCEDPMAGPPALFPGEWTKTCDAHGLAAGDTALGGGQFTVDAGNGVATFHPGLHCDPVTTVSSFPSTYDVVFEPGIYHLRNVPFTMHGSGTVTGTDVQFLFSGSTSSATAPDGTETTSGYLELNQGSPVALHAPDLSGPSGCGGVCPGYTGQWTDFDSTDPGTSGENNVLFYQDPNTPDELVEHELGGGSSVILDGVSYFAMQNIWLHGNITDEAGVANCTVIIANKFRIDGTDTMDFDTSGCGSAAPTLTLVDLVMRLVD